MENTEYTPYKGASNSGRIIVLQNGWHSNSANLAVLQPNEKQRENYYTKNTRSPFQTYFLYLPFYRGLEAKQVLVQAEQYIYIYYIT